METTDETPSLATLLKPYRLQAVAEAVGTDRSAVLRWKRLEASPTGAVAIMRLSEFLKMDPSELLAVIVADAQRRSAA